MSIFIKENIDNIDDLPNISVLIDYSRHISVQTEPRYKVDEKHIDYIIKSITNIISKKKLIIQLLNQNLTKKILNNTDNIPFTKLETEYCNDNTFKNISHNHFKCYPENINFLHLVIYHNINIDKLLLFLLYKFYINLYNNNNNKDYFVDTEVVGRSCIGKSYVLYYDVINSANKFDKYNFNFGQDYETLFLGDYENLKEDDMNILIEKNKELEKRIDIIIEQNNIQYNDTKNDMNILIEKNKELEKRIDIIIEQNNIIEKNKELEKRIDIIIEQNNNEIDKLNKSINKLSNQIEVYKTIVNNLLEDRK